ncbi:Uncharacterized protein dnm_100350 [Desulfonema magnum]|uniref:Uncharacterized protein n=1 Tax=Desulfonema magnum TaxID=45655 RepID=A0A975GUK6_9BACT|nr:Uncharacterized protein dnm_100350 [Desulfonema magnum]
MQSGCKKQPAGALLLAVGSFVYFRFHLPGHGRKNSSLSFEHLAA